MINYIKAHYETGPHVLQRIYLVPALIAFATFIFSAFIYFNLAAAGISAVFFSDTLRRLVEESTESQLRFFLRPGSEYTPILSIYYIHYGLLMGILVAGLLIYANLDKSFTSAIICTLAASSITLTVLAGFCFSEFCKRIPRKIEQIFIANPNKELAKKWFLILADLMRYVGFVLAVTGIIKQTTP